MITVKEKITVEEMLKNKTVPVGQDRDNLVLKI